LAGAAVEAVDLVKVYRGGVRALQGLSAEVPVGSLYCVAGPNGAGKTTFVRIASTVVKPTSGFVRVLGYDVVGDVWRVRRLVALMPQEGRPYNDALTVEEAVYYYLLSRGFPRVEARAEARRALEELDLWEHRGRLIVDLSGGLRRRVLLAMVLASGADVLFLDEPTVGLDVEARRQTWGYIRRLAGEGRTIVFTTHLLSEAESVANRILLVSGGRRVFEGDPREAVSRLPFRFKVIAPAATVPDWAVGEHVVRVYEDLAYVYVRGLEEALRLAEEIILEGGQAQVKPVDLEDYFVWVVEGAA